MEFRESRPFNRKVHQLSNVVAEYSQRTAKQVGYHSRRYHESLRSIDTLGRVSRRTTNTVKRKIGEPQSQMSILLGDSMNL